MFPKTYFQRIALSNKFIPCPAVAVQHVRHFLESGRRIAGRRLNAQKIKAKEQKQTQPLKKERTFEKGSCIKKHIFQRNQLCKKANLQRNSLFTASQEDRASPPPSLEIHLLRTCHVERISGLARSGPFLF